MVRDRFACQHCSFGGRSLRAQVHNGYLPGPGSCAGAAGCTGHGPVYRGLSVEVGRCIPFPDNNFDIVVQYTVFSSVLDDNFRKQLASEMLRVSKPEGLIISYDFWPNNPHNKDVRGVTQSDIRRLFPGCRYHVQRIILAPPISRRVAPISSVACEILERIPVLRSHFLIGITAGNS